MPRPSAAKMASACTIGSVTASPSEAPMKGAVQGEATATASTPVSAESATGWRMRSAASDPGNTEPNSNTPARFRPISVNSAASAATKPGDCSWKPQPSCSPPARSVSSNAASARKLATTPAVYANPPASRTRPSCAWMAKPTTFSDRTGNTQGIRFSNAPPASANKNAAAQPSGGACGIAVVDATGPAEARAVTAGQGPSMGKRNCTPAASPSRASTTAICAGAALRCADKLTRAIHASPSQRCTTWAALSITSAVSGRKRRTCPIHAAGRPRTRTSSAPPSTRAPASAVGKGRGSTARAASKSAAAAVIAARAGSSSANSPSSGMHTSLHTSHCARSRTDTLALPKPVGTCKGTANNSRPS